MAAGGAANAATQEEDQDPSEDAVAGGAVVLENAAGAAVAEPQPFQWGNGANRARVAQWWALNNDNQDAELPLDAADEEDWSNDVASSNW